MAKQRCAKCGRIYNDPDTIYEFDRQEWCGDCRLKTTAIIKPFRRRARHE